jgi:hypothetical protein
MIPREIAKQLMDNPESIHSMADPEKILAQTPVRLLARMLKHQPALAEQYQVFHREDVVDLFLRSSRVNTWALKRSLPEHIPLMIKYYPSELPTIEAEYITPELIKIALEGMDAFVGDPVRFPMGIREDETVASYFLSRLGWRTVYQMSPEAVRVLIEADPKAFGESAVNWNSWHQFRQHGGVPEELIQVWEEVTGEEWVPIADPEEPPQGGDVGALYPPPSEEEMLPSKDVKKGKFLKKGYSVRGVRGKRRGKIPGILLGKGEPFTLSIASLEPDLVGEVQQLPAEMYQLMDLHGLGRRADLKRFIGWIGGTITDDAMWVHEAQSDLMQRTWQFQTTEAWNTRINQKIEDSRQDLLSTRQELRALKLQYQSLPASERFKLVERIHQLEKDLINNRNELNKYPNFHEQHAEHRSKIENLHAKWIEAFYHIAIWYAKKLNKPTLYIATSKRVAGAWSRDPGDESTVYTRAYDGIAQKLGAQLVKAAVGGERTTGRGSKPPEAELQDDWWKLDISAFTPKEDISRIAYLISEYNDVLLEGMDANLLKRALENAGYGNIRIIKTPDEEQEYQRVDIMAGTSENDKFYQLGDPNFDVSDDRIDHILNAIGHGELRELTPDEVEGMAELEDDATLLIIATKQVGDRWIGVSLVSLDDPRHQFDTPSYRVEEDEPNEALIQMMSRQELEDMFSSPSWGEDAEAP